MPKSIGPNIIEVQKPTITGDEAVIMVSGLDGSEPQTGKVTMIRRNNQWLFRA